MLKLHQLEKIVQQVDLIAIILLLLANKRFENIDNLLDFLRLDLARIILNGPIRHVLRVINNLEFFFVMGLELLLFRIVVMEYA